MKYLIFLLSLSFLFFGCFKNEDLNFKDLNNRFDYTSRDNLWSSIQNHLLLKVKNKKALDNFINTSFEDNCKKNYQKLIDTNNFEKFLESNPQEFLCFIDHANMNRVPEKFYFLSTQAFLRSINNINKK